MYVTSMWKRQSWSPTQEDENHIAEHVATVNLFKRKVS